MTVGLDAEKKTLNIKQELIFINQSSDTLTSIVLNDWNYAFSNKNSALAKRFSDEFYRGFHLAKEEERGSTLNLIINDAAQQFLAKQGVIVPKTFIIAGASKRGWAS